MIIGLSYIQRYYTATTNRIIVLSVLLLIVIGLGDRSEGLASAQITPSGQAHGSGNSIDNTKAAGPITPSEQPSSGFKTSENSGQKYAVSIDPDEETLLERIFGKVNMDLQSSGITGLSP